MRQYNKRVNISLKPSEWREIATKLKAALTAIHAVDTAIQLTDSAALRRSIRGARLNLTTARVRSSILMEREYGYESARNLFYGEGWPQW